MATTTARLATGHRSHRGNGWWATALALWVFVVAFGVAAPATAGEPPVEPAVEPTSEPAAEPAGQPPETPCPIEDDAVVAPEAVGTSATGECVPSRRIRLVDSAVWVFTVVVFVAVIVAVLRGPARRDTDGDPPEDPTEPGDGDG